MPKIPFLGRDIRYLMLPLMYVVEHGKEGIKDQGDENIYRLSVVLYERITLQLKQEGFAANSAQDDSKFNIDISETELALLSMIVGNCEQVFDSNSDGNGQRIREGIARVNGYLIDVSLELYGSPDGSPSKPASNEDAAPSLAEVVTVHNEKPKPQPEKLVRWLVSVAAMVGVAYCNSTVRNRSRHEGVKLDPRMVECVMRPGAPSVEECQRQISGTQEK